MASSSCAPPATSPPFTLDAGTAFSLAVAFSLMPMAQALAARFLPASTPRNLRFLFLWHAYDFLTHFIIEGSYLYHCFVSYVDLDPRPAAHDAPCSPHDLPTAYLFDHRDRRYGALYSQAPMARLWQEYAKADTRWGGADLTIISLELLTVGLAGPAAAYVCYLIAKTGQPGDTRVQSRDRARLWVVAIALATGELYGGFMTFAPEWLSGNTALRGDDPVYLWLYLVFFNMLWVFIPAWVLSEAYTEICQVFARAATGAASAKTK